MPDLRYVSANGLRIAVYMGGPEAAPPIVLLHGLGELAESWAVVRPSFERDYRVIAPDLRGHGRTDWPGEYSIELMAADTVALIDELNVGRVAVMGHSMGGSVAYQIAEVHPERVERLIIEDVPPPYPRVGPPIPDRPEGVELPFDWDMLIAIRAQVDDPDMTAWECLGQITAKTLIVAGGHKSHVSQEKIAEAARLIPDATVVTIEAGHHVHVGQPELFASTVLRWLSRT
jgi:3-oxoadipate enol-lactonase